MKTRLLFLYSELAEYFLACVKTLVQEHQVEVHIVRWPINREAPFVFQVPESIYIYEKQDYSRDKLIQLCFNIAPDLIFCSGWMDKDYLAVARSFKKQVPVLVGIDNHWKGTLKQQLARLVAPFTLKRIFTHAFVAGTPQSVYAQKLGFTDARVIEGYYAADVPYFSSIYKNAKPLKEADFPKRFIYVGRYIPHKGLNDLWQAFIQLQEEQPNDWELWCLGTGPLEAEAADHPKVRHLGFVQPKELVTYIAQCGVFVLPSHFEPWGVVVHEFAAAGYPLICSDKVGAATAFLQEDVNGYTFNAGNISALMGAMKMVTSLSDEELLRMGEKSIMIALQNTPSIWSGKLISLLKSKSKPKGA